MTGYGGGYPNSRPHNNSGGATQSKSGDHFTPLCRKSGYDKTMGAMDSRTKSQYPHSGKHYQYESAGDGTGGNTLGWHPE